MRRVYTISCITLCLCVLTSIPILAASKRKLTNGTVIAKTESAVPLKPEGARAALAPVRKNQALSDRIAKVPAGKTLYLVLKNIQATKQPEGLYHVYLNLEEGKKPTTADTPVGTLNFFNYGGSWEGKTRSDVFFSFNVTEALNKLIAEKRLSEPLTVTIIPAQQPSADEAATIGQIELVEQ